MAMEGLSDGYMDGNRWRDGTWMDRNKLMKGWRDG